MSMNVATKLLHAHVEQGYAMLLRFIQDPVQVDSSHGEFRSVAPAEDVEAFGPVAKPFAKPIAGGEFLEHPSMGAGPGHAPGPQTIDEVPPTTTPVGGLVDAFQGYRHGSSRIAWHSRNRDSACLPMSRTSVAAGSTDGIRSTHSPAQIIA